jgi:RNA polymerase sigma factor (TIGR02999 family)
MTDLLHAASGGDRLALDQAFERVYEELHRVAHGLRRGSDATLSTTALVHEAWLKLVPSAPVNWEGREHFVRVAARAMRQVLIDSARAQTALKRGGGDFAVTFEEDLQTAPMRAEEVLALDEALLRLDAIDARAARVVEFRFFAGLSVEETAATLQLSPASVKRDWRAARAWLLKEIGRT